ncbi:hypothetical protein M513_10121, partial [Trichuris suis]
MEKLAKLWTVPPKYIKVRTGRSPSASVTVFSTFVWSEANAVVITTTLEKSSHLRNAYLQAAMILHVLPSSMMIDVRLSPQLDKSRNGAELRASVKLSRPNRETSKVVTRHFQAVLSKQENNSLLRLKCTVCRLDSPLAAAAQ